MVYPISGPEIKSGWPIMLESSAEFEKVLASAKVDAGLVIAPDDMQPRFLEILEKSMVNLGCSPEASRLAVGVNVRPTTR